ncbi:hypothetical protein F5883DRAFT_86628 [Diaporthe sp. PMI_573]|nr:hypothetical protein F5883DRAFT_86628 [Diaporthaceae sp. PMI_573]
MYVVYSLCRPCVYACTYLCGWVCVYFMWWFCFVSKQAHPFPFSQTHTSSTQACNSTRLPPPLPPSFSSRSHLACETIAANDWEPKLGRHAMYMHALLGPRLGGWCHRPVPTAFGQPHARHQWTSFLVLLPLPPLSPVVCRKLTGTCAAIGAAHCELLSCRQIAHVILSHGRTHKQLW